MAPRNQRMPPNQIDDTAAATTEDASLQEAMTENEMTAADDVWAQAEGYTPLADLRGDGAMFMAFDPNNNQEQEESFSGTFFADKGDFGSTAIEHDNDWNDDEHEGAADEGGGHDKATEQENEFRSVADQALQALDEEYSMALGGVVLPPTVATEINATETKDADQTLKFASNTSDTNRVVFQHDKETPPIDTDAVRKAVDKIKLKAPRLTSDLNKWEEQHGVSNTSVMALAPRNHGIIPKTPLAAFWRQSSKAIAATANLSRSATCAEAIQRLELLNQESLVIHVVGADHVECSSDQRVQTLFGPLIRWIGALPDSPQHVYICLVGPNVPSDAATRSSVDLLPANKLASSRLESATATCHEAVYHEWLEHQQQEETPDLAICFNSGVWGYNEWIPTLKALCQLSYSIPFVSTAYTIQECEDDAQVIEEIVASSSTSAGRCLWNSQANPFASRQVRETHTALAGREYRENAAWQAWRLGTSNATE